MSLETVTLPRDVYEYLTEADSSRQNPVCLKDVFDSLSKYFTEALKSQDLWTAADIARKLRRVLSVKNISVIIDLIIRTDLVKNIVKLLDPKYYERERLIVECSWIVLNIASGNAEQVGYLVKLGIIKKGIALLKHPDLEIKKNTIWLLANLAGEPSNIYRNQLIEEGIVKQIEWVLQTAAPRPSLLSKVTWLISNLVNRKPYPDFEKVKPLVKYLKLFMNNFHHAKVRTNTLWILSYLTDGDNDQMQIILDLDPLQKIFESLRFGDTETRAAALRTTGNFLTGYDSQAEALIRKGVINILAQILDDPLKALRKEASWALSNIMAGNETQLEKVFREDKGKIMKKLFEMISSDEADVARECIFCLTNACYTGTSEQIQELLDLKIIRLLMDTLLKNGETTLIVACLEALQCILDKCHEQEDLNEFDCEELEKQIIQCGGLTVIQNLQSHSDSEVQKLMFILMNSFYYVTD